MASAFVRKCSKAETLFTTSPYFDKEVSTMLYNWTWRSSIRASLISMLQTWSSLIAGLQVLETYRKMYDRTDDLVPVPSVVHHPFD